MRLFHLLKISRLESLSDGIFAIAMTILILDLRLPPGTTADTLPMVFHQLIVMKLFIYAGSFITLGTLWVAMNFQLGLLDKLIRQYLWANIYLLMVICVIPFSAILLAGYSTVPLAIDFYATNLLCASVGQLLTIQCAHYYKLNKPVYNEAVRSAIIKRIFFAPPFYIVAILIARWNVLVAFTCLLIPTAAYLLPGKVDKFETLK